jgi:phage terminase small subunit
MSDLKPLSKKHARVLDEYLLCFNQTAAYRKVYPKTTYESAKTLSSNLFTNVDFSAHVAARLEEAHMSADEALQRIAEIARGDIGDFMAINSMGFELDLEAAREAQKTGVIKRVRQTVITVNGEKEDKETITTDIELHDKLSALRDILKMHNKFTERVDVTNSDGSLKPPQIIEVIKTYEKPE